MTSRYADGPLDNSYDAGRFGTASLICIEPQIGGERDEDDEDWVAGCGWEGQTRTIEQYGSVTLEIEECPECGGEVEVVE